MSESGIGPVRTFAPIPPAACVRAYGLPWLLVATLLLLTSCATPVGVRPAPNRELGGDSSNASGSMTELSAASQQVLQQHGLLAAWETDADHALAELTGTAIRQPSAEIELTLAEINWLIGQRNLRGKQTAASAPGYLLGAMAASWQVMARAPPTADHPTSQRALEIYNASLRRAFLTAGRREQTIALQVGSPFLPAFQAHVPVVAGITNAEFEAVLRYLPTQAFSVRGLSTFNSGTGLGLPLVGVLPDGPHGYRRTIGATLVARVEGSLADFQAGNGKIVLELIPSLARRTLPCGDHQVPVAFDTTTPMAYALDDRDIWSLGRSLFFNRSTNLPDGLHPERPHQTGKIPVVLVHGLIGNPIAWAELVNTLSADPLISQRFEFWFFIYRSGNPTSHSANRLREALQDMVAELDPEGTDPALRQMVLIGHSQGGLLVRLVTTDPGDKLWRAVSNQPFEESPLSPRERARLRTSFFSRPLPTVSRTVFMATPHRGSSFATGPVSWIGKKMLRISQDITSVASGLIDANQVLTIPEKERRRVPNSIDGMSPKNPWLLALADLPSNPGIPAHSIIGIHDDTPVPEGSDGVVKYTSAHLADAASERVIRSGHGMQRHPDAIAEVRRILRLHLQELPALPPGP